MAENDIKILVYIGIVFILFLFLKTWSFFWKKKKKKSLNNVDDSNKNQEDNYILFEQFYFTIYFMIYLGGISLVTIFSSVEYLNFYSIIPLLLALVFSILFYKKMNPQLTNIISTYEIIEYSSFAYQKNISKKEKLYYFFNTFFTFSIFFLTISVLIVYFGTY